MHINEEDIAQNPNAFVNVLFDEAYVGGWSAAEYWDLISDLSHDITVITSTPQDNKDFSYGIRYRTVLVDKNMMFGIVHDSGGFDISDLHKTVVDMVILSENRKADTVLFDVLNEYERHKNKNYIILFDYMKKSGHMGAFRFLKDFYKNKSKGGRL